MSFSYPGWWWLGPGNHPLVQETWQTCHLQAWHESHQSLGLKTQGKRWHLELGFPGFLCMCARELIAQPLIVATSKMTHNEVWNWAIKLRPLRDLNGNNKNTQKQGQGLVALWSWIRRKNLIGSSVLLNSKLYKHTNLSPKARIMQNKNLLNTLNGAFT